MIESWLTHIVTPPPPATCGVRRFNQAAEAAERTREYKDALRWKFVEQVINQHLWNVSWACESVQ
jgi:hypothetical protein